MSRRLLYLDGYTVADPKTGVPSSDAIGYGVTASSAIRDGLAALGFDLRLPRVDSCGSSGSQPADRLVWLLANYRGVLAALIEDRPDVIFSFHAFSTFPLEIRRMALDLGLSIPLVGYTHGSHWDPTDASRFENYPGMEMVDLANLHVLDRVLLVSDYMRSTLLTNIGALNTTLARQLDAKTVVVGLPLDVTRIDRCRTGSVLPRPTVVFNHSPVSSKNPALFAQVMARVLPRYDAAVLITRNFLPHHAGGTAIAELADRFPEQVVLGRDMPLDDYYAALWAADLQVSTATHESLGVSTLEAMYTGNCCILPRLGSYPEICHDHPDVLYDYGAGPLEERLRYFLDNPERRRAVAAELRAMTAAHHPAAVVGKIAAVLADVLPADGPATRRPQLDERRRDPTP